MKKRVKKDIKRKKQKKNIFMNDKFLLSILLLGIVIVGFFITFNRPVSENYVGDGSLAESSTSSDFFNGYIVNSEVYKAIRPYIVPDVTVGGTTYVPFPGLGEFSLLVIGIITLVILFVVIYDIFSLIPIFSQRTMRVIAIGLGIVMILLKVNVVLASWLFTWGIAIFAGFGSFAVVGAIILAIILLFAFFFGGNKFVEYLSDIRVMRENLERKERAKLAGGRMKALESFEKGAGI